MSGFVFDAGAAWAAVVARRAKRADADVVAVPAADKGATTQETQKPQAARRASSGFAWTGQPQEPQEPQSSPKSPNRSINIDSMIVESEDRKAAHVQPAVPAVLAVEAVHDERRAIVRCVNDHFRSSPPGVCTHCGRGSREDDPFVILFVGEDRADLHASCHSIWLRGEEEKARVALGYCRDQRRTRPHDEAGEREGCRHGDEL